jgi:Rhs element Vgr protein
MDLPTITIESDNEEMNLEYEVVSLDVSYEVGRIPEAQVVLLDGEPSRREFAISDTHFFEPGKKLRIKLDAGKPPDTPVFEGLIVRHAAEAAHASSVLTVEARDEAIKLTRPRKTVVHRDQTDGEVIGKLIRQAGLKAGFQPGTRPKHAQLVQYHASDWDFLLMRAEAMGFVVVVESGKVSLARMALTRAPELRLEFGMSDILDFELVIDAGRQPKEVVVVAWDAKNQNAAKSSKVKAVSLDQEKPGPNGQKGLDVEAIVGKIGAVSGLDVPVPLDEHELNSWASAQLARSRLSMIRGRIAIPGTAKVKLLDVVQLAGVSRRFNGKALVTGIRHRVDERGWQTDLQLGLSPDWHHRRDDIGDPPAAGLLPAAQGLQIGVVDKFEEDPNKEFRARVKLPTTGDTPASVWARLLSPDAGKGRGFFFRPETGDEVVLGFLNGDPRHPVILGALFGSTNAPPDDVAKLSDKNVHKAIVTRKGTTIRFIDDDKPSVLIQTPGKNTVTLDDKDEVVKLEDKHGNSITMNKEGAAIKSAQDLKLEDKHGNSITMNKEGIAIKSAKDLKLEAGGDVEIKGSKVDVK